MSEQLGSDCSLPRAHLCFVSALVLCILGGFPISSRPHAPRGSRGRAPAAKGAHHKSRYSPCGPGPQSHPAVLLATPGSYVCIRFLQLMTTCSAPTDAAATAIAAHAAAAACAARRVFAARCWGASHAPRRMAAASRSTALKPLNGSRTARGGVSRTAQRPSGYARWRGAAYPARMPCRV